jgi:hypothetical protein
MKMGMTILLLGLGLQSPAQRGAAPAQDIVHYSGRTMANVDYPHGQLAPAIGVHNVQVFRANRAHPAIPGGPGWTYNHAPMLAYWHHAFYLEYLSDLVGESVPPGRTLLCTSADGVTWSTPKVLFPPYKIPDGTTKEGHPGVAKDLFAVMHQRMGFYVSKRGHLLALAFYGICLDPKDDPNDGLGIGRVVREIRADGSWGPVYFIHYNPAWNEHNTTYPYYTKSPDKGFVADCDELMANPLMMMQWVEETDRKDPLIPLHKDYKAFNFYHLDDGRVVGLWKNALTGISKDGGRTWGPVTRAPHFVNSNAKIWGQKTSDGRFVTVYNPSEFRWPLALSVSADGLDYTNLLLVQGNITTMRYGGNYKSYGPQYVRGIEEGNGVPPDGKVWVTYSMNKEDIWVASIPVPITDTAGADVDEDFDRMDSSRALERWNTYSPLWAPVGIARMSDGRKALRLEDRDPFDVAEAERLFPPARRVEADFTVIPAQKDTGMLLVEFRNARGDVAVRLTFDKDGVLKTKAGPHEKNILQYAPGHAYDLKVVLSADNRFYTVTVNGKSVSQLFFTPVENLERIVFRTGPVSRFPDADTPSDQDFDVPDAGRQDAPAVFFITHLKTHTIER